MLYTRNTLTEDGARLALMRHAAAVAGTDSIRGLPKKPEACQRCGLVRAVHSTIIIHCIEGRTVEAPLCGRCSREMSR
ncbi:MAG: hypothetical protein WCD76_15555 [Pyrinomonadaceae bacterium]